MEKQGEVRMIRRGSGSDPKFQREVYDSCCKRVFASCYRILGDIHESEDIMQEAFIQAFQKMNSYRGESTLATWICRIAVNKCLDHLKKRRVSLVFDDHWEKNATLSVDPDEDHVGYDARRILKAMEDLPDGCRVVFSLHIFEEMDHKSIAERLGIKEGSSRAQYARAKNQIIELLKNTYV